MGAGVLSESGGTDTGDATVTIAELIERLKREPADTDVEYAVIQSSGEMVTMHLTAKTASTLVRIGEMMDKE